MVFHDDIHIRTNGLPARGDTVLHHFDIVRREQAGLNFTDNRFSGFGIARTIPDSAVGVIVEEVQLHAVITLGHGNPAVLRVFFRRAAFVVGAGAPSIGELAGVGAQVVPALAAQQLVDRHVERLALDVPQGDVQGGDAGKDDGTAVLAPEGGLVELVPDDLVVQRVHADDQGRQIPDHAEGGGSGDAIGQSGLAVAVDALVRINTAEDGPPGSAFRDLFLDDVDFRDLHAHVSS